MKICKKSQLVISLIISVFVVITACSDDEGAETPSADLSGTWEVQEKETDNCGGESSTEEEIDIITMIQEGNDIEITFISGSQTFEGTISGNDVKWKGVMSEGDGSSSVSFSGKVSEDGNTITGNAPWTYSSGSSSYTCNGETEITAKRIIQSADIDVNGVWDGNWESYENSVDGTFTATITRNGSTLSGTIDVPFIDMYDAQLKGTYDGVIITFGDIGDRITFTGIVKEDLTAYGIYRYPALKDNGSWYAEK